MTKKELTTKEPQLMNDRFKKDYLNYRTVIECVDLIDQKTLHIILGMDILTGDKIKLIESISKNTKLFIEREE